MKRLSLIVLVVSLLIMTNGASAYEFSAGVSGYWDVNDNWLDVEGGPEGDIPKGNGEIKIRYSGTHVTLDYDSTAEWSLGRIRMYNEGEMTIEGENASIHASWMRAGTSEGPGFVHQNGCMVKFGSGTDGGKLTIGDQTTGDTPGLYEISGGTLTYSAGADAYIVVGYKGGKGKLRIVGDDPVIQMRKIYVGGTKSGYATVGTVEFDLGSGVSPIELTDNIYINRYGDGEAYLEVHGPCVDCEPGDIVLMTDTGGGSIEGTGFTGITDDIGYTAGAKQGQPVYLAGDCCGLPYCYYKYSQYYDAQGDGNKNDIALIFDSCVPEPATVALFGLGLMITALRRPRKK